MRNRPEQSKEHLPYHQQARLESEPASSRTIPTKVIKPWTRPPVQSYILDNINIVDPISSTILPNRTVHLANGNITSITTTHQHQSSSPGLPLQNDGDATQPPAIHIDGTAKFLTPGLIDAHVHLTSVPGEPDLHSSMSVPGPVSLLRQPFQAAAMLARGYTTVRDCGGASLALKEAIADGVFPGPRLFIAGHALSQTGGHGDRRGAHDPETRFCCGGGGGGDGTATLSEVVDGVPAVLRAAREQLRQGADFLKLMAGGGVASPTDKLAGTQFTTEEMRAAADVADASGTFATAHAYTPAAIRRAVEAGVRGIEHGNFVDAATAGLMRSRGVFLTPTLVTYRAMADPKYAAFLPAGNREKNEAVLRAGLESVRIAYEAGVTMCLGSDLLSFLGVEQLGEFGLRAQVLPPGEVLRHATVNPAKMLGQQEVLGQVKEGFVADLLVLNADPLEDITVFERPEQHLLAVIKDGRVYDSRWSKLPVDVQAETELLE
ncbi:unnamed protein product [Discula destructiva]